MPSFSFLKRSKTKSHPDKPSTQSPSRRPDSGVSFEHEPPAKSRRFSAQKYLRRLSSKHVSARSVPAASSPRIVDTISQQSPPQKSPSPVASYNHNKPLPPPPPPGAEKTDKIKPPTKLERILTTLNVEDVHSLFSGAPHFFPRSNGQDGGKVYSAVAFPWDTRIEIRDLRDHGMIRDEAWRCVTASSNVNPTAGSHGSSTKPRPHFAPLCKEKPNMLSMLGLERGTMGYQAALELSVADALQDSNGWSADPRSRVSSEHRAAFLHNESLEGVRVLSDRELLEHLVRVSKLYLENPAFEGLPNLELYTDLFTKKLHPPSRVIDAQDPYSLQVQIDALLKVLATPNVWVDFGLVEWRIRLGQILWSPQDEPAMYDDEIVINGEEVTEGGRQKYWLLLQVLMASELLIRLDKVTSQKGLFSREQAARFDREATRSVRWSLLVARCWLDNINIEIPQENTRQQTGWFSTLTGVAASEPEPILDSTKYTGRYQERQANGLVHFAQNIDWPRFNIISSRFLSTHLSPDANLATPATSTPMTATSRGSSYFGNPYGRYGSKKRMVKMAAVIHPSGWLSRSYLSGLVLPGEALSHFLMSTLLENDDFAVQTLGEEANLYGGFVYNGKSFWSGACVVGRILAAGKGARECMGWISTDIVPQGLTNRWLNLDVDFSNFVLPPKGQEAGSSGDPGAEHDASLYGGADISSLLPGDFVLVQSESASSSVFEANLEALEMFVEEDEEISTDLATPLSDATIAPGIQTYSAMMRFSITVYGRTVEKSFAITHDVYFVASHPCIPTDALHLIKTPASPQLGHESPHTPDDLSRFRGHPLHKSYSYVRYNLASIIAELSASPFIQQFKADLRNPSGPIMVIDCADPNPPHESAKDAKSNLAYLGSATRKPSFGSDVEMLARAWCSELGVNAIISRKGRSCVSCSIREARALDWKVVLRFG